MSRLRWSSGMYSHAGNVRERNEDSGLDQSATGLWAVADGMGGHAHGDRASQLLIERLTEVPAASDGLDALIADVSDAAAQANQALVEEQSSHAVSGTTLVALAVADDQGACLWVGDSRAYRLRDGQLQQLTRDHTEAPTSHVLTRAIGAQDRLEVDVRTVQLSDGDKYLLCSDGLHGELDDQQIAATLAQSASSTQQAARRLVERALQGECADNVTALVVEFEAWG